MIWTSAEPSPGLLKDIINQTCVNLGYDTDYRWVEATFPVRPVPCPRPRFLRSGRSYFDPRYQKWRTEALQYIDGPDSLFSNPVCVGGLYALPQYKTVDTQWPTGDIDNYMKSHLDAVNTSVSVWHDDIQVVFDVNFKRFVGPKDENDAWSYLYIREVYT